MKKYFAEFIGTLALILVGCGAIVIGGFGGAFPVGILPIALAFGLTVTAMAYAIGPLSGAHINPAVTVGMWVAGRINPAEAVGYIIAQLIGGIAGAGVLVLILKGKLQGYDIAAGGLGRPAGGPAISAATAWAPPSSPSSSPPCCSSSSSSARPARRAPHRSPGSRSG